MRNLIIFCAFASLKQSMAFTNHAVMLCKSDAYRPTKMPRQVYGHDSKFTSAALRKSAVCLRMSFWKNVFQGESAKANSTPKQPVPISDDVNSWQELSDPSTGRTYFWNKKSGATTWEKPAILSQSSGEKLEIKPLVAPDPKQFAFSNARRTPAIGVCSAAGKSGGRLKENQDSTLVQARLYPRHYFASIRHEATFIPLPVPLFDVPRCRCRFAAAT